MPSVLGNLNYAECCGLHLLILGTWNQGEKILVDRLARAEVLNERSIVRDTATLRADGFDLHVSSMSAG